MNAKPLETLCNQLRNENLVLSAACEKLRGMCNALQREIIELNKLIVDRHEATEDLLDKVALLEAENANLKQWQDAHKHEVSLCA